MINGHSKMPKEWKELLLSCLEGLRMLYNNSNAPDSPVAFLENVSMVIYAAFGDMFGEHLCHIFCHIIVNHGSRALDKFG